VVSGGGTSGVGVTIQCIPGKQYTSTWYVRQTGANTTQIFINGGAGGTSTATTGAYVRLSLTWTATQPTHQLWVASFATSVNSTVNVDAVQNEPGAAANAFATTGPLLRGFWPRGYVERWPTAWESAGFEGQSNTPCVGPFAILANADLKTELTGAILAKAPAYLWRLNEPAGSTTFAESSGNNGPPLLLATSPSGAGGTFAAGTQTNIAGEPGRTGVRTAPIAGQEGSLNVAFQFLQLGYAPGSTKLTGASTASGSTTSWALTTCFVATRPAAMVNGGSGMVRFTDPIRNSSASAWLAAGVGTFSAPTTISDTWGDGKPHLYVHVSTLTTAAGGTFTSTYYVDGAIVGTQTITGAGAQSRPDMALSIGGQSTYTFNQSWQDQTAQDVAYWNRALSAFEIADLNNAFTGYVGEGSGARITRYLSLGGYIGPTSISAGSSSMGQSALAEGTSLLAACQGVADSEFGNFFEGATGVTFTSRFSRYLATTSAYTFGENIAGGEYPYLGDINFDIDPTLVLNIADVTQAGGVVAHAEDAASQKRYGKKNFTRTVSLQSANETIDAATWVVYNRRAPSNRVAAITLNPDTTTNLPFGDGTMWAMIIALEIGTRVTVKRRAKAANGGAGITQSADFYVESINHHDISAEASTWATTLLLSPVPLAQPWILENATYGVLDSTTVLGF
jgi:hypothetical protein